MSKPLLPSLMCLLLWGAQLRPAAAQSAAGETVVGGPYAVNVGPRSATVMWVVQTGVASLGTEPGKTDKTAPVLRAERTTFTGLKRGTTYYYQVFAGDAGRGSFKTPPMGEAQFQFVVYGDTRTRHEVHRAVIASVLKYANPDFVMHTGDLVADGNDPSLWPIFFDAERELLRKAAFFPSLGNHERDAGNYFDFLSARPYYSFDWGSAHFTVINSDIENVGSTQAAKDTFWQEQTRWLENDLQKAQKADFRFVFAHHPPMTAVKRRQGENPHMTALEPLFEKYRLSAGFFGHDHNYQHYLKNGVHYFITGGGGAPLYDVDMPPVGVTQKVASTENFVVVQVNGRTARVEGKTPDGQSLDITQLESSTVAEAPSR
ncbi:MAG TPA: metallophosphoesterase [Bryobacteraceae bacterium]|nr:metallophosphoesterase [Bryobacteraceae bacterium]